MNLLEEAKKIKRNGIIGLILFFTLFGIIVTFILDIISAIKILSTNWKYKEIEDQKMIWGILSIVLLGPIAAIVFGSIAKNKLEEYNSVPSVEKENNDTKEENK